MKNDSTLQERPKSMMQGRYDTLFKAASFAGMTRKQQESYMRWLQIIQDNWSAELYAKRILTRTLSDAYTNTISPVFNLRRRDYKYIQKKDRITPVFSRTRSGALRVCRHVSARKGITKAWVQAIECARAFLIPKLFSSRRLFLRASERTLRIQKRYGLLCR